MARRCPESGILIIKSFEGILDGDPTTVNLDPYLCPANVATIGWGHAVTHSGVQLRGNIGLQRARAIYPDGITPFEAEDLLADDVAEKASEVESLLEVEVTDNQFAALVSFAFNVGTDIDEDDMPEGLGDSTLLRKVNAGDFQGAAGEFPKWNRAAGKVVRGLTRRREAERALFLRIGD